MASPALPPIEPQAPDWFKRFALRLASFFLQSSQNLADLADAVAARANLGLGPLATQPGASASAAVTSALGYTPISGITSGMVTSALGFTPLSLGGGTMTGTLGFSGGTLNFNNHSAQFIQLYNGSGTRNGYMGYWDGTYMYPFMADIAAYVAMGSGGTRQFVLDPSGRANFGDICTSGRWGGFAGGKLAVSLETGSGYAFSCENIGGVGGSAMAVNAGFGSYLAIWFLNGGGIGSVQPGGSGNTLYNTTSDERLKDFSEDYAASPAVALIRADPVRHFTWNDQSASPGVPSIGWGAQTSYALSADLASPGNDKQPGEEGFLPWGMDFKQRVPHLWAAVGAAGGILDRLDAAEAAVAALTQRVAALEAPHAV